MNFWNYISAVGSECDKCGSKRTCIGPNNIQNSIDSRFANFKYIHILYVYKAKNIWHLSPRAIERWTVAVRRPLFGVIHFIYGHDFISTKIIQNDSKIMKRANIHAVVNFWLRFFILRWRFNLILLLLASAELVVFLVFILLLL